MITSDPAPRNWALASRRLLLVSLLGLRRLPGFPSLRVVVIILGVVSLVYFHFHYLHHKTKIKLFQLPSAIDPLTLTVYVSIQDLNEKNDDR